MKKVSLVAVAVLLMALMAVMVACGSDYGDPITMEQFNRVEVGMVYEDVAAIFERPGRRLHERGNIHTYQWNVYPDGGSGLITITFMDDVVYNTHQVGLD